MNKPLLSLLTLCGTLITCLQIQPGKPKPRQAAGESVRPVEVDRATGVLYITETGYYTGTATRVVVAAGLNDNIHLDRLKFDNLECTSPCNLTITNCTVSGKQPTYSIVVWRFQNLVIENNRISGRGILFRDFSGKAQSYSVRFNKLENISGMTGPDSRFKVSAIQAANLHVPGEIAWNWIANTRGASATEDAISAMQSGGTPASPLLIHDNFVDGVFNWPVITPENHLHFSGSAIMCFDPGNTTNVTVGGYTRVYNNVVLACENQAFACAGGHDIEVYNNRAVNDGTSTPFGTVAYQVWNFANKTPGNIFGQRISLHDNFSSWVVNGVPGNWRIEPSIKQFNNRAGTSSEAAERAAWAARCADNDMEIGPKDSAFTAPANSPRYLQYTAAN